MIMAAHCLSIALCLGSSVLRMDCPLLAILFRLRDSAVKVIEPFVALGTAIPVERVFGVNKEVHEGSPA